MNKLTALTWGGLAWLCLLLALPCAQLTAQTELCPPYPRAMDQAFVCIEIKNNEISLKLDPKAGLHNPVRFRFTTPPKNLTFTYKTQHRRTPPQPLTAEAAAAFLPSPFLERACPDVVGRSGVRSPSLFQHSNFSYSMKKRFLLFLPLLLGRAGVGLLCGLLCLLPGCKKDPLDGKTTITGRVTEYGTQTPVADATLYLMCYEGTFGGGGTSNLLDSVRTDADGRYSISYTDCGSTYLIPYKKGYLQHIDVDLGGSKTADIVLDPEAWFKLVTIPDLGMWEELGFGGSLSPHSVSSNKGVEQQRFIYPGGRSIVLHWGPFSNPSINYTDSIYLVPHDTTTYTIHY
jgi:hypothetical protein